MTSLVNNADTPPARFRDFAGQEVRTSSRAVVEQAARERGWGLGDIQYVPGPPRADPIVFSWPEVEFDAVRWGDGFESAVGSAVVEAGTRRLEHYYVVTCRYEVGFVAGGAVVHREKAVTDRPGSTVIVAEPAWCPEA